MISGFMIVKDEEELIQYAMESWASLGDMLKQLSIVDNNSTDATLEIIRSWQPHLPITLQHHHANSRHGVMRNMALAPCTEMWIMYLDSDETVSANFADWLRSGELWNANQWQFHKYSTIKDRYHHAGGDGPSRRMFRNVGATFPQEIHTEPTHHSLSYPATAQGVFMFDHTSCKSEDGLWAKGMRYAWAARAGVEAIGPVDEYIVRVADAKKRNLIEKMPRHVCDLVFTGPLGN